MAYATDIGIDLGTSNIVIFIRGKGIVLKEPAVIAYDRDSEKIKAFGVEAHAMIGRTPGNIAGIRPLKDGIISDYVMTEELLKYFIQKAMGNRGFLKPRIVISIPTRITDVEKRAVEEASYLAGARDVTLVEKPLASAIGAGIDVTKPSGTLVVDIGAGVTDMAVVSLGGTAVTSCVPIGGSRFTESIIRYLRKTHLLFIGEQTAENVKIRIGTAQKCDKEKSMEIRGRNIFTGLPSAVVVTSNTLSAPLNETANSLADAVCAVLEQTTPELANDVMRRGIILTGGGAMLRGIDDVIKKKTGIETTTAEHPDCTAALGAGRYLELIGRYG